MHLIVIGADQFKNTRWNLIYPAKDAKDIIQLFTKDTARYAAIDTITLSGSNVTLQRIAGLKQRLANSKINDQVIVFYSGHGVRDKQQNYYLASADMDFSNPSARGITTDLLESLFDGIPALSKVLLIDACQSGEADVEDLSINNHQYLGSNPGLKLENKGITHPSSYDNAAVETAINMMQNIFIDLRRRTGTTILSSAGPIEYALEANQWQNSAFTYALKKGLGQKAADYNHDGRIMLSELSRYLRETVPQLTDQRQQPTSRMDNEDNDFQIF